MYSSDCLKSAMVRKTGRTKAREAPHGRYLVGRSRLRIFRPLSEPKGLFSPIQVVQRHIPRAVQKLSRLRDGLPIFQVHMRVSCSANDTVAVPGKAELPTMTFQTD